jgi:hypothetical protein
VARGAAETEIRIRPERGGAARRGGDARGRDVRTSGRRMWTRAAAAGERGCGVGLSGGGAQAARCGGAERSGAAGAVGRGRARPNRIRPDPMNSNGSGRFD